MKKNILALLVLLLAGCYLLEDDDSKENITRMTRSDMSNSGSWTFMVYMAADNDLEANCLDDVNEMVKGYTYDENFKVVILVDRFGEDVYYDTAAEGDFGENFTDTRLYTLNGSGLERVSGGAEFPEITKSSNYEANTGDAEVLKKFIRFAKASYSADNYALIIWNHGTGPKGVSKPSTFSSKDVATDLGNDEDTLYIGEISDILTAEESVDLLGFDACFMGSAEIAYQFSGARNGFKASIMVGSPAEEWADGWDYEAIFSRINSAEVGYIKEENTTVSELDSEIIYDPYNMNAVELSSIIVEEFYDAVYGEFVGYDQTQSSYDLEKLSALKTYVDELSVALLDEKSLVDSLRADTLHYFNEQNFFYRLDSPFFDIYDLALKLTQQSDNAEVQNRANDVMLAASEAILFSFGTMDDFENGKNGIYCFLPYGDEYHEGYDMLAWTEQFWYNPNHLDVDDAYGNLYWCADGATENNGAVENWFELLDYWYDKINETDYNSYVY